MKRDVLSRMLLFFIAVTFFSFDVIAQAIAVKGTVKDKTGEPIIGANILVKGTTNGTITDFDGNFQLNAKQGDIIVFSFIGFQTQEQKAALKMNVTLKDDTELLDEVVVVAYGTATKRSFTGSATEIKGDRIANKNPSELSKALTGEVAGVQVISTSGQPGSNASIRIRGLGSVNSSRAPLYVVDGIPFGSDLSGIDPSDIESTTVLKDATATALYGSRAANGVILLTTKRGKKGKTQVEANVKYGINTRIIPLYDTMENPERFLELTWEGIKNKYMYRANNPKDEATAKQYASKDLFDADYGIAPVYNMWKAEGKNLIDPVTGRMKAGVVRKFTPEKWEDYIFRTGEKVEANVKISGGSD